MRFVRGSDDVGQPHRQYQTSLGPTSFLSPSSLMPKVAVCCALPCVGDNGCRCVRKAERPRATLFLEGEAQNENENPVERSQGKGGCEGSWEMQQTLAAYEKASRAVDG